MPGKQDSKSASPTQRPLKFQGSDGNQPDEFYEFNYAKLVIEIHTLAKEAFSSNDLNSCYAKFPWLRKYSDELFEYVQTLACPDNCSAKWDGLLRNEEERVFLVQGVITKFLDTHVLSSLLFGAQPEHELALKSADQLLVDSEGFERSRTRAETNRMYLQSRAWQPPNFWANVSKTTKQLLELLHPIYTYAGTTKSLTWKQPSVAILHQQLHDTVAYAGWLNVCMRLSPAIMETDWALPGELHQMSYINLSPETFSKSADQFKLIEARRPKDARRYRPKKCAGRVKISVTPSIVRHLPKSDKSGISGTSTYTIFRPHVVYYQGLRGDQDEKRMYISLPDWIKHLETQRRPVPQALALMILLTVVFACCYYTSLLGNLQPSSSVVEMFQNFGVISGRH